MKKLTFLWLCFLTYKMGIMNCASELRLSWEPGRRGGPPAWPHSSLSLSSQRELSVFYFCRSQRAELGVGHVTVCGLIPSPLSGVTIYSSIQNPHFPFCSKHLKVSKPPTSEMTWVFLCKGTGPFQAMAPQWRLVKMLDPRWCVWFPGYLISSEQCKGRTAPWVLSCFFPDPLISSTAAKPLAPSTKHSANTADPNMLSPLMLYLNPPRVTPFAWQE